MFSKTMTANEKRGFAFAMPGLIVTAILILYPIISVIQISFVSGTEFVGLENYIDIFQSHQFGQTLSNTFLWTITTVLFSFFLGTASALILNQSFIKGKGFWRSILMLSWITPGVVKATVWKWLYSYDFGMFNHMLIKLNIIHEPISWLTDTSLALGAVVLVQIWATFPFVMLMMSAGLQSIPKELNEVSKIDGATGFQHIRFIIMPMLKDVTFISLLILIIWSLNEFSLIWIITQGGPAGSSQVLSLHIYDQFRSFNTNAAAATAVLQLFVSLIFAIWYIKKVGKEG